MCGNNAPLPVLIPKMKPKRNDESLGRLKTTATMAPNSNAIHEPKETIQMAAKWQPNGSQTADPITK